MSEMPAAAPVPAKKKHNTLLIVLIGVFAVLALCVGGAVIAAVAGIDKAANVTTGPTSNVRQPAAVTTTAAAKKPTVKPKPEDFKLTVKVIKKQCFGSAGCNVSFRIDIAYTGLPLQAGKTYEVVYEVRGGQDPLTNRFEVTGDTASYQEEEFIQTRSANSVLTAVPTEVNELGR